MNSTPFLTADLTESTNDRSEIQGSLMLYLRVLDLHAGHRKMELLFIKCFGRSDIIFPYVQVSR